MQKILIGFSSHKDVNLPAKMKVHAATILDGFTTPLSSIL